MPAVNPHDIAHVVEQIRPLLGGKPPELQGAVLADLLLMFIAGHHPLIRDEILRLHVEIVRKLVEPNEHLIFGDGPRPFGWDD